MINNTAMELLRETSTLLRLKNDTQRKQTSMATEHHHGDGNMFFFEDGVYKLLTEKQMTILKKELANLDDRTKTMITLRYIDHKSFAEIGDQFSVGAERTRQIIGKGVRRLREELQKRF